MTPEKLEQIRNAELKLITIMARVMVEESLGSISSPTKNEIAIASDEVQELRGRIVYCVLGSGRLFGVYRLCDGTIDWHNLSTNEQVTAVVLRNGEHNTNEVYEHYQKNVKSITQNTRFDTVNIGWGRIYD